MRDTIHATQVKCKLTKRSRRATATSPAPQGVSLAIVRAYRRIGTARLGTARLLPHSNLLTLWF